MVKKMVQVIQRSLNILETIAEKGEGFGILELARKIRLPNSTVHRLLNSLKNQGYVIQDPSTGKYSLGYKILSLAGKLLEGRNLKNLAVPYLKELTRKSGETSHLVIFDGEDAICIESVECSSNMRVCSPVGEKNPLHCTAVGKAILANLPEETKNSFLKKSLKNFTENTLTSPGKLKAELDAVKKNGYAVDREEYQAGISCVAAPIRDVRGTVTYAVGISYPSFRISKEKEREFIKYVKETSRRIGELFGGN